MDWNDSECRPSADKFSTGELQKEGINGNKVNLTQIVQGIARKKNSKLKEYFNLKKKIIWTFKGNYCSCNENCYNYKASDCK